MHSHKVTHTPLHKEVLYLSTSIFNSLYLSPSQIPKHAHAYINTKKIKQYFFYDTEAKQIIQPTKYTHTYPLKKTHRYIYI